MAGSVLVGAAHIDALRRVRRDGLPSLPGTSGIPCPALALEAGGEGHRVFLAVEDLVAATGA